MPAFESPLLFVLAAVAGFFALEAGAASWRTLSAIQRRRARLELYGAATPGAIDAEARDSLLRGAPGGSHLERLLGRLVLRDALALELRRAAMTITPTRFALLSLALAWIGFQLLLWWAAHAVWALPGLALGLVPWALARQRSAARTRRFEAQFPEALDLLIRALRAGHSLSAGLQLVGEELPDPIGGEFAQVSHEIRLGQPTKRALDNLVLRVANPDVAFFATAVAVQQETGSNLVEVLHNLAGVIRDRFQLFGKVRALTSLGRASANLLVVWPAVMVFVLWTVNADYVAPLWETQAGHSMVLVAGVLVVVGFLLCRRMATIRV
jgi:tight adherence protein B